MNPDSPHPHSPRVVLITGGAGFIGSNLVHHLLAADACLRLINVDALTYAGNPVPEKLIPLMIANALAGKPLPVYGDGHQVRDWLYVEDHCRAIECIVRRGAPGRTYNVGGRNEWTNIALVGLICDVLEEMRPSRMPGGYRRLITHVADRPGHDRRYAIDAGRVIGELGWKPLETFESGIRKTVRWYLDHPEWVADLVVSRGATVRRGLGPQGGVQET